MSLMYIPTILGVIGLVAALVVYSIVVKYPSAGGKVASIGDAIHLGAMVFMRAEYKILGIFVAIVAVLIAASDLGLNTMYAFLLGAACSSIAGYMGMFTATKANVRTTTAAHERGASEALTVAFFGGSVMGLCVASMGLLG